MTDPLEVWLRRIIGLGHSHAGNARDGAVVVDALVECALDLVATGGIAQTM